jgi:glycosyltransferase involved in cell wall biosynthesis
MINVLHLRDTDRICGPGKTIIETACATDRGSFTQKVGLFLPAGDGRNAYYDAAVRRGVEIVPVRSAHRFDPRLIGTIIRIINEHDIHLVHSHEYKSDILAYVASRLHPIPIMSTIHGWITNHLKSRLFIRLEQAVLPRFDKVVAVSGETKSRLLACGVPADKITVIHNAIVTEHYDPGAHPPGFLRSRYGVPDDGIIIGYIGRLSPEKGQRDLLVAAATIAPAYPRLYVALVGDGPDRPALEQAARELGLADRVIFTGHLADVRPVYRDLQVLALTSHTEGFPNVVLEALCMEIPVLATDVGGVREIVEDGRTGVLIPARSPEAVAKGLRALLDDPAWARTTALAGKRAVYERFAFATRVAREEAVYREILAAWKH